MAKVTFDNIFGTPSKWKPRKQTLEQKTKRVEREAKAYLHKVYKLVRSEGMSPTEAKAYIKRIAATL